MDDLDFEGGDKLGHYLKIWADKWACTGETKGGTIPLNHHRFIVTSQYTIRELYGPKSDDTPERAHAKNEIVEALERRFIVHEIRDIAHPIDLTKKNDY